MSCAQAQFGITLRPEAHVLELDSTTGAKFSRHLIVSCSVAVSQLIVKCAGQAHHVTHSGWYWLQTGVLEVAISL
jgi:hypothetical protein